MRVVGIGAGGHAKVLLDALLARGDVQVVGLIDADPELKGMEVLGVKVLGGDDLLPGLHRDGIRHAFLGVGGTSDNTHRQRLWSAIHGQGFKFVSVVHPSAVVAKSAVLGEGACLCPGAIVGAGATLGSNVIVNTGAIVEHDCALDDHVHIASGAVLAGGVIVGEGAHVGAGASVRQGIRVGAWALVAMGAAVVDDVPDRMVVAGVPARPLRSGTTA
jgi:sugar O-acyltransferase (sialic acid O-acetyltransferase NeuD family)